LTGSLRQSVLAALALMAGPLAAQSVVTTRDALAFQSFDKRGGLLPSTVYSVARDRDGLMWIGSEEGAAFFTGHRWQRVVTPSTRRWNDVRVVLPQDDGTLWFATRGGVIRIRGSDTTHFTAAQSGLVDDNVYDLREVTIFGGKQVLAASYRGLSRFDGTRFQAVAMPPGFAPHGTVTAETLEPGEAPSLWVATPNLGLWRLHRARWEAIGAANGLSTNNIEAVLAASPRPGGPTLYVAGADGVFELVGNQFRGVVGAPRGAFRLLEVIRASGDIELWVGTTEGRLMRRLASGAWERVEPSTIQQETPIMSLSMMRRAGEEPIIWVGYKSERLTRVVLSQARPLPLPPELEDPQISMVRTLHLGERTEYWIGTRHPGVLRVSRDGSRFDGLAPEVRLGQVRSITRIGDTVWVAGDSGVASWVAGRWRPATQGLGDSLVRRLIRVTMPDGSTGLYASAHDGIWHWESGRWRRFEYPVMKAVTDVVQVLDADGTPVLWAADEGGQVWKIRNGVVTGTIPGTDPVGRARVVDLTVQMLPGGGRRLWAATTGFGGLKYLDLDVATPAWRLLGEESQDAMPSDFVRDLALGPEGRLYGATPRGLVQLRVLADGSVALERVYGTEDGLPSDDVFKIEYEAGSGDMLVGTRRGLGWLRPITPSPETAAPLRLVARTNDAEARPLLPDARLDPDAASLSLDFALLNYVREGDTRYRSRLLGGDGVMSPWTANSSVALSALAPGRYQFEVWSRDYRGQVSGPAVYRFTVAPPWWQTPPALALATVLALFGIRWLVRWRTTAARERAQELEVRERLATASERRFRALFDRAFDAHLLVDGQRVTAANAAAEKLFGVPVASELVGLPLSELVPISSEVAALDGGGVEPLEVQRRDGTTVPVEAAPIAIPLEGGGSVLHVVLRDLSEERRAAAERQHLEEQVRESQKIESLGTLAGGIAHDFNNLLTVIGSNTELLLEQSTVRTVEHRSLETIRDAANRARDLVRQILTFSRRSPRAQSTVSLNRLIRDLEALLRPTLPSTISFDVRLPAEPLAVVGDLTQLQQMLLNLCVNAEYAMRDRGGNLTLALEELVVGTDGREGHAVLHTGRYARLIVEDTGVGITPEVQARIFEPFFTTKPVGEGTGLGLSVLHGIVLSHHGSVAVSSEPGLGTLIEVLLPISDSPVREERPSPSPSVPDVPGARVLLVDDDAAVLSVTQRLLTRLGYQVTACSSGAEALAHLTAAPDAVDLVLTDQTMPGMTGDRLLFEAKQLRPELPVMILTGFSHVLTPERIATLGAAAVLYKPVARDELVAAINGALSPPSWS
jgi:PAS domain S-box-containing protein